MSREKKTMSQMLDTGFGKSLIQILSVVIFFAIWQILAEFGLISEFLVGTPFGIWKRFIASVMDYSIFIDTGYTLWEALLGFVIGTLVGTSIGLLSVHSVLE